MNDQETKEYYANSPSARWMALVSICLTNLLNSVTHSAVNVATPVIAKDLQPDAILVSWIPTSFLLATIIVILPAGRLADKYGRKKIYIIGTLIFAIASITASFANSIELLLVIRLIQGLGSAMIFATSLAIIMSVFSSTNQGSALGMSSASIYIGLACGPMAGGWCTEIFGWRSVFIIPAILILVALLLIAYKLKGEWKSENAQHIDWLGAFIFSIWASTLFLGVSAFPKPESFLILLVAFSSLFLFFYQQSRSDIPLINFKRMLKNKLFSRSLMANTCIYSSSFPLFFIFSLYLQFIQGLSPSETGQIMVLQAITMAILAPISGRLSDIYEPRIIATIGCLIMACAFVLLMQITMDTPISTIAVGFIVIGVGFGMFSAPNNNAAMGSVDKSNLSIGAAMLNLSRTSGNMLGTAVLLILVSLFLGNEQIEPAQYPALLKVTRLTLTMSFVYCVFGAYFSYNRGNIR